MTYSILIPLRNGNPDDPRGRIKWWAAAEYDGKAMTTADKAIADITRAAWLDGCREVVFSQPYGTATGLRVESDQIRRLGELHRAVIAQAIRDCLNTGMRPALFTGFGWSNQPWSPFRWRLGKPSNDGKWRYPDVDSSADRRAVFADLAAAKAIGFDSVWIDQLASVDGELGNEQGARWAWTIQNKLDIDVVGEAHWPEDSLMYDTSMVSLGREIDARGTRPRGGDSRDIAWINGHSTIRHPSNVFIPKDPLMLAIGPGYVRTPADQVEAGRRYAALGFEVCYEVDSVQTMRGIVEARAAITPTTPRRDSSDQ